MSGQTDNDEWDTTYEELCELVQRFGTEHYLRSEGDCWVDDDDIGTKQQKLYVFHPKMLKPEVVCALQQLVRKFPGWEIVVAVGPKTADQHWPDMGLIIRPHEIIDGLQRQYFPPEYQDLHYPGSRVGTDRD